MLRSFLLVLCLLIALPADAVEPDEILDDPALEARARVISKDLRCLVCRNESIDESNAELAKDLRVLVRERILAGDTNEETVQYVVDRYGEYVLLKPRATGTNLILWVAGPVLLVLALIIGAGYILTRRRAEGRVEELSAEEEARLQKIMEE